MPESLDDLWHLYNIILKRDQVHARTTRQVKPDDRYARPTKAKRVPVNLGVQVEKMYWDRVLNRLRIKGIVIEAPEKLSIKGSRHTLDITVNKPVTIAKKRWQKHELDRLKRASKITAAPLTIISMDDEEYCVAVLRQYGIDVKTGERIKLPGKFEAEKRGKAKQQFFGGALKSLREAWAPLHSPIVILGPGFIKDDFLVYINIPLEVSFARVLLRSIDQATDDSIDPFYEQIGPQFKPSFSEKPTKLMHIMHWQLRMYLQEHREVYLRDHNIHLKDADLIIDGMKPKDELANEIIKKLL